MMELDVERLTNGPEAMARAPDGRVVFLDEGLPGERVAAEIVEQRRDYARAHVLELLDPPGPSPHRREPPCRVVRACGGCPWQHLTHAAQLELGQEVVLRELWRHARTAPARMLPPIAGPEWRTRNRVRLAVARDRGGAAVAIGYRGRSSHAVVAIEDCVIAHAALVAALPLAHAIAARLPSLVELELLVDDRDELRIRGFAATGDPVDAGPLLAALHREARGHELRGARLVGLSLESRRARESEARWRTVAGDVEQKIEVQPGIVLRVPLGVFTQVNLALHRELVADVVRELDGVRRIVDLYAGCGNFSIPLALAGATLHAVEANEEGVGAARRAAEAYGVASRCRFEAGSVAAAMRGGVLSAATQAVVLDPPRAGAPEVAATLASTPTRIPRVVYVSCDVASFARDTAALTRSGYRLESLRLFDLTPQTHRAEVVGVFVLT
jgi:23S rRNA (uracil1939-C5)-methyltransferase